MGKEALLLRPFLKFLFYYYLRKKAKNISGASEVKVSHKANDFFLEVGFFSSDFDPLEDFFVSFFLVGVSFFVAFAFFFGFPCTRSIPIKVLRTVELTVGSAKP